jgi:hypothetical protein
VSLQNDEMRSAAAAEIAAGSTCPVPAATAAMTDEQFAGWDERIAQANLDNLAGYPEEQVAALFARMPAGVQEAYHRLRGAS